MSELLKAIGQSALGPSQTQESDMIAGKFCFSENFIGFSGHFPGYPILPAVVQLMLALSLIEEQKGRPLQLRSIQNAKFLTEIRPGDVIEVRCRDFILKDAEGSKVQIYSGDKIAASFFMTFANDIRLE
jgi:3-hydroxyacyl-[acyl-carrier-protein] dehydratase